MHTPQSHLPPSRSTRAFHAGQRAAPEVPFATTSKIASAVIDTLEAGSSRLGLWCPGCRELVADDGPKECPGCGQDATHIVVVWEPIPPPPALSDVA
jgi:hypothetical protein